MSEIGNAFKSMATFSSQLSQNMRELNAQTNIFSKKLDLASKSVSILKGRYEDLASQIRKVNTSQLTLNKNIQKGGLNSGEVNDKKDKKSFIKRIVSTSEGLDTASRLFDHVNSFTKVLTAPIRFNSETAAVAGKARSYGVKIEDFNAWDILGKQFGSSGEGIGNLFAEYVRKEGEFKRTGTQVELKDSLSTLGLKDADFSGMSSTERFNKIIDRALSIKDESKASSALSSLFGADASNLLMFIRSSGRSFSDLVSEQKRYSLVSQEGADGAIRGNVAFNNLQTVLLSAAQEISGVLGGELAPRIKQVAGDLADWFRNGGLKTILNTLREKVFPAVMAFGEGVVYVGKIAFAVAQKLSWLLPDEKSDKKKIIEYIAYGNSVPNARLMAERQGYGQWFTDTIDQPGVVDKIKKEWRGSIDSAEYTDGISKEFQNKVIEKILTKVDRDSLPTYLSWNKSMEDSKYNTLNEDGSSQPTAWPYLAKGISSANRMGLAPTINDQSNKYVDIHVNAAAGQSEIDIANNIVARVNDLDIFNGISGNNAMYDLAGAY